MTTWSDVKDNPKARKIHAKGFILLDSWMGDDAEIAKKARMSYGKGTKKLSDDIGLIRYLLRHKHTSPFEMVEFTFLVKMPIFVARQWIRHRTANVNEYSARYSILSDEFYIPDNDYICEQSSTNNQGSGAALDKSDADIIKDIMVNIFDGSYGEYEKLINGPKPISRELARTVLPVAGYTEMYWKCDLHNIMHFLKLRMDPHAQQEIRDYANAMYELVKEICPIAMEAFDDYIRNGKHVSAAEVAMIRLMINQHLTYQQLVDLYGSEKNMTEKLKLSARELREFKETWLVE